MLLFYSLSLLQTLPIRDVEYYFISYGKPEAQPTEVQPQNMPSE